jgi:hypothetical protein
MTIYVDADSGNDANGGTGWGDASLRTLTENLTSARTCSTTLSWISM